MVKKGIAFAKIRLKKLTVNETKYHGHYWAGTHFQEIFLHENSLTRTAFHDWLNVAGIVLLEASFF